MDPLTLDSFAPHQGSTFELEGPTGSIPLELAQVSPLGHGRPGARAPFALLFLAPDAKHLEQRIWPLTHPQLGRLEIFLVPLGPREGRMRYEAIFN